MAEEIVDVVNEQDEVLYSVAKSEAHEKGPLHRTVIAEIKDSTGRWILVKQAADRQDAGQYVSPVGGHVRSRESEDEALKREALEETGLEGFKFRLVGKVIFNREVLARKENHYFILYEIFSDEEPVGNAETDGFETFTDDELREELAERPERFGDAFFVILKEFYPYLLEDTAQSRPQVGN